MLTFELYNALEDFRTVYGLLRTKLVKCFGGVEAQIVLAPTWGEILLQLEQLAAYSEVPFLHLAKSGFTSLGTVVGNSLDWLQTGTNASAGALFDDGVDGSFVFLRWTRLQRTPYWDVSTAYDLSSSRPAQFLSAILACPTETVLVLLHLLFWQDIDRQHLGCNTELVTSCATWV